MIDQMFDLRCSLHYSTQFTHSLVFYGFCWYSFPVFLIFDKIEINFLNIVYFMNTNNHRINASSEDEFQQFLSICDILHFVFHLCHLAK